VVILGSSLHVQHWLTGSHHYSSEISGARADGISLPLSLPVLTSFLLSLLFTHTARVFYYMCIRKCVHLYVSAYRCCLPR
jgi:hypothetical protein